MIIRKYTPPARTANSPKIAATAAPAKKPAASAPAARKSSGPRYFEFVGGASADSVRSVKADVVAYVLAHLGNPDRSTAVMIGDRHHDIDGSGTVRDAKGEWRGVPGVVDKDLTSALLARSLGIPDLLILTAIERVAVDFGTPRQRLLGEVTLAEMKQYQRDGHFARGSMGPKVEAAIRHLESGGRRAIIGHLEHAAAVLAGKSGTHVVR